MHLRIESHTHERWMRSQSSWSLHIDQIHQRYWIHRRETNEKICQRQPNQRQAQTFSTTANDCSNRGIRYCLIWIRLLDPQAASEVIRMWSGEVWKASRSSAGANTLARPINFLHSHLCLRSCPDPTTGRQQAAVWMEISSRQSNGSWWMNCTAPKYCRECSKTNEIYVLYTQQLWA